MVPPGVLEEAAGRGQRVHEWTELLDQGFLSASDEPDDDIAGFIEAYLRFKAESGFVPEHIEIVVINKPYRYAGTLDRTGTLRGEPLKTMVDIKTGQSVPASAAVQTAGYAFCLEGAYRRHALDLFPDGSYSLVPYNDRNDIHDFLAAVRVAHWRIKHQGVTLT